MKSILNYYFKMNPFVIFSPFLLLFIFIILKFSSNQLQGDEGRYLDFAKNIINGFYSPPSPNINLWNGPGYPLFITPFVWIKAPLIIIKIANAFLQYFSIVLLFYAINKITTRTHALIFSFIWGFYYLSYQELTSLLSEPFTSFLSALTVFFLTKVNESKFRKNLYILMTGFTIGILSLTKIIFGYVLLVLIIGYSLLLLFRNSRNEDKRGSTIIIIAFLLNTPYLIYTYNLTGKVLYWGNSGGNSLYWMSTPIEGEFGDWNNSSFTANCGNDLKIPCNSDLFAKNHQKNFDYINNFPIISQDDEFKKIAIMNIKSNPIKYIRNCISNFSRLLFGIPNSYFYQREQTIWRILPNAIIFTMLIICLVIAVINYKNIKSEVRLVIGLTVLYLFFSTLVSAYPRHFYVIIPFLFFWFSYIFSKTVVLKLKIEA